VLFHFALQPTIAIKRVINQLLFFMSRLRVVLIFIFDMEFENNEFGWKFGIELVRNYRYRVWIWVYNGVWYELWCGFFFIECTLL